ncbi:YkgJ family cysteine cluster protein [Thermodesulfobacteriota bacterium]
MDIDFKSFFKSYEDIVAAVESVFANIQKKHADCVKCKVGCADCCHALFDLTMIEAIYINYHFNRIFKDEEKNRLLEKANQADRKTYKIKRNAHKDFEQGKHETEILNEMALQRVRCPLLDNENRCELYHFRPITCRLYGIPTSIAGKGHTCGLSGFVEGQSYPTVNIDAIHQRLYAISAELVATITSKYVKLAEMLVPLSMALLTEYDETYLGIRPTNMPEDPNKGENNG